MLAETCIEINRTDLSSRYTAATSAEAWIDALLVSDPQAAQENLRLILLKGLCAGLSLRFVNISTAQLEEIVERALAKITARVEEFPGERRFTSWALKIAVQTALQTVKQS